MIVIINGRVVGPRSILEGHCVMIEGTTIKDVVPTAQVLWPADAMVINAKGQFVAPGFVDLHVHGGAGRDLMEANLEALVQVAKFHVTGGTTAMTPTTTVAPAAQIEAALATVDQAIGHDFGGAQILGAHIESPYISPAQHGTQPPEFIRQPNPGEYERWLTREGLVTQVTLAPELPGVNELVDSLLANEIIPSAGHTAATHEQARAGIDRGICHATHLFCCMSAGVTEDSQYRPGALETFLADDRVMAEVIADDRLVHPELLRLAVRAKGTDKVCLVTCAATGRPSKMIEMVKNMVELIGVSLPEAVRMASLNPARALGLNGHKGSLERHKDADIVMFSPTFQVTKTLVGGQVEFDVQNQRGVPTGLPVDRL